MENGEERKTRNRKPMPKTPPKRPSDGKVITASELKTAVYCPESLRLQREGADPSQRAQALREAGERAHQQTGARVQQAAAQNDRRCYVASHLYGPDDPRTDQLRDWRDRNLMPSAAGRWLVAGYYRLSPMVVLLARRVPFLDTVLGVVLNRIVSRTGGNRHGS
ncbi:CFI-box-CTERM domain-containing protein [Thioalkalivibrio sp. ALE19]|uniref:CFI-box-CTERM domain-containing protein n=1 Tax=Thioalkalivibrio sp. ALE19 TaxID=1266909 RepID=UPI001E3CAAB7|nr:CFI-box-CTERM domain-containing protein [Thioalkalivibrio sp. ALE19]